MATHQSPLAVIVKGALAGAAGTAAMGAFMERAPQLLEGFGVQLPAERPGPTAPDSPNENPAPTNVMHLAAHVVYGVTTAVVYGTLNFGRRG